MTSLLPKNKTSLFKASAHQPLAERMRPQSLDEVIGQRHLLGADGFLRLLLQSSHLPSLIFWGAAGTGKTTLAHLIARESSYPFVSLSAVSTSISDLKPLFEQAKNSFFNGDIPLILFMDEIHRFHRGQQDAFLPHIESGALILLGATTENPSFELNGALLSRCQVVTLTILSDEELGEIMARCEQIEGKKLPLDNTARKSLVAMARGDARALLNMADILWKSQNDKIMDKDALLDFLSSRFAMGDKDKDVHYNLASALHKSLRASDCDGSLYWLARSLEAGESADFIARRLVRFASEDIGMADPHALQQALAAWDTWKRLGAPEGELALAGCVIYMSLAAKSNASYRAWQGAQKSAHKSHHLPPPKHILNAPTSLMKKQGYGKGYVYDHDTEHAFDGQNCFPHELEREAFYHPVARGYERELQKRLQWFEDRRKK